MADQVSIDFNVVDKLLIAGCDGEDVAGYLGIHADTLYNRVKHKFGVTFTAYSASKRRRGDAMIKAKRFEKAMNDSERCLLNLCEIRLGEGRIVDTTPPNQQQLDDNQKFILENYKLTKRVEELEAKLANQSQANTELCRS